MYARNAMKRSHLSNLPASLPALAAIHSFCLSVTVLLDMNAIGIADTVSAASSRLFRIANLPFHPNGYSKTLKNFIPVLLIKTKYLEQ